MTSDIYGVPRVIPELVQHVQHGTLRRHVFALFHVQRDGLSNELRLKRSRRARAALLGVLSHVQEITSFEVTFWTFFEIFWILQSR